MPVVGNLWRYQGRGSCENYPPRAAGTQPVVVVVVNYRPYAGVAGLMPASIARIEVFVLHLLSAAAALPGVLATRGRHVARLRNHVAKV